MADRWTASQKRALLDGVGSFGWSVLRKQAGKPHPLEEQLRTKDAIVSKIRRDFGGGGITRGMYSLREAEQETNYNETHFRRAAKALNQRWIRTARRGNFLISAEQLEDMVAWLQKDYWCKKLELYGCTRCGTVDQAHRSGGLCGGCFRRVAYLAKKLDVPFHFEALHVLVADLHQSSKAKQDSRFLESLKARLDVGKLPLKPDVLELHRLMGGA